MINKFFCEVGEELANYIPNTNYSFNLLESILEFVWHHKISVEEVLTKIGELDAGNSSVFSAISIKKIQRMLKMHCD